MNLFKALIFSISLSIASLSAYALDAGYYAPSSKLASGHWVKIKVSQSGIQQITYDQLRQWGFNNPASVTVHGYGGVVGFDDRLDNSIPDDLSAQPAIDTGDRILFYGESDHRVAFQYPYDLAASQASQPVPYVQRNNAATAGYYFLTDGLAAPQVEEIPFNATSGNNFNYHYSIQYYEENVANPFRVGQHFYGPDLASSGKVAGKFSLTDRYMNSDLGSYMKVHSIFTGMVPLSGSLKNLTYTLKFHDYVSTSSTISTIEQLSLRNYYHDNKLMTVEVGPNIHDFNFSVSVPTNGYTYGALDYMAFAYPRLNVLRGSELLITYHSIARGDTESISSALPSYRVWNVADAYNVRPYATEFDSETSTLKFTAERDYSSSKSDGCGFRAIVFDPDAQHNAVEFAGEVASQDLHSLETPDLLIVASELCRPQAERLARLHRERLGHNVLVLSQEEIFNEFSSGTPSPWAIRRAVKMFYDRNSSGMRALLLFGGGIYDNSCISATAKALKSQGALLMTYGTRDYSLIGLQTNCFTADTYFGLMDETTPFANVTRLKQHVAVGRIPALTEPDAIAAVDKVEAYLTDIPALDTHRRPILVGDEGDSNSHLLNTDNVATTIFNALPGTTNTKAYVPLFPLGSKKAATDLTRRTITEALNTGAGFFCYSGHGKPDSFSGYDVWNMNDVNTVKYKYFPLAMLATCEAYAFDEGSATIAGQMVLNSSGGMIGAIAHCRKAYQSSNQTFNELVGKAYARATSGTLTGEIFMNARNNMIAGGAVLSDRLFNNTFCYNHAGDPALPIYVTEDLVVVESINGSNVESADTGSLEIIPLGVNTIEGYIHLPSDASKVDTSFNGTVTVTVYESPVVRKTNTSSSSPASAEIFCDSDILCEVPGTVVNGRFSVDVTLPLLNREGDYNRINIFAATDDLSRRVAGTTNVAIARMASSLASADDTEAPQITSLYINSPAFRSGDVVSNNFTVVGHVAPDASGVRRFSSTIGGSARVVIDNSRSITIPSTGIEYAADGSTTLSLDVNTIGDGRHELTLFVSDNVGNSASASTEFVVINEPATATLQVAESVARTSATISLANNFTGTPTGRLVIEDAHGNTILSRDNCTFPYEWDLFGPDKAPVADGVYSAYAILNSGLQYGSTPRASIVVIQGK